MRSPFAELPAREKASLHELNLENPLLDPGTEISGEMHEGEDGEEDHESYEDHEEYFSGETAWTEPETLESRSSTCQGYLCWAKEALSQLQGSTLTMNAHENAETRKAIQQFQTVNGLKETGKLNAATERKLLEADAIRRSRVAGRQAEVEAIMVNATSKIEDWTSKAVNNKPNLILNKFRDPRNIKALVLHQMAFKRKNRQGILSDPVSYLATGAHFCIMLDGRIIQLHPISRMIWHSQGTSAYSVGVEFEGNFPDVKGRWWINRQSKFQNKDNPTHVQFEAGRFLASWLKELIGIREILAHRQSSNMRENDPGPDVWFQVGEWAISNLGLSDGGPGFKKGTGLVIHPEWRTWGQRSGVQNEFHELGSLENYATEDEESDSGQEMYEADLYDEAEMGERNDEELIHEDSTTEDHYEVYIDEFDVKDFSRAVMLNRKYASRLGWDQYRYAINDLLLPVVGKSNVSLDETSFAQAVYQWQKNQGFSDREADGIIGPGTWARLRPLVVKSAVPDDTKPLVSSSENFPFTATLGELVVDTSIPALKKSIRRYQFTSDDAVWLARFVEGEAGGRDNAANHAVIWAMFNRFGMLRHKVPAWKSFAAFLRLYSTTLQPFLNSAGAAERVWHAYAKDPVKYDVVYTEERYKGTNIKKVQYKKHIRLQQKPWKEFPDSLRDMVIRMLTGKIPNPGIGVATHFASTMVYLKTSWRKKGINANPSYEQWKKYTIDFARSKNWTWIGERSNLDQTGNAFFIQDYLKQVPPAAVRIEMAKTGREMEDFYQEESFDGQFMYDEPELVDEPGYENESSVSKAIELNRYYGNSLGWNQYHDQINELLLPYSGMQYVSLGEEAFVMAVSAWQKGQGFSAADCDGVIGPRTWSVMRPLVSGVPVSPPVLPVYGTPSAPLTSIHDFNKWHAQKILDSMNAGIIKEYFGSRSQLEKIVRGEKIHSLDPVRKVVEVLPLLSHIAMQAASKNYRDIIFGSFIRQPDSSGKCTGHCAGRSIDINHVKGSFESADSLLMVKKILGYLKTLPAEYRRNIGFGMPLQGGFFGNKSLPKFRSVDPSNLNDAELRELVRSLGIVFPDNNNHLHIQITWSSDTLKKISRETAEEEILGGETEFDEEARNRIIDFENYALSVRLDMVKYFTHILFYKVPDALVARLKARNMQVQYAHNESYSNDLNIDFYSLQIHRYPVLNGLQTNAESLLRYIRLNINLLIDTSYCDFYPYDDQVDKPVWLQYDPTGAVLKLDIKGPDNATVVVSHAGKASWRFTTVTSPLNGKHPVSGHRDFFINMNDEGKTVFVIKGVDMMSTGIAGLGFPIFGSYGFAQADALWKSMVNRVIDLINNNGGSATKGFIYSERVEWKLVYRLYKHGLEKAFGKGAGSAANSSFFSFEEEETADEYYV